MYLKLKLFFILSDNFNCKSSSEADELVHQPLYNLSAFRGLKTICLEYVGGGRYSATSSRNNVTLLRLQQTQFKTILGVRFSALNLLY